jgi:tetratricopeptide (TPR) repeat protein
MKNQNRTENQNNFGSGEVQNTNPKNTMQKNNLIKSKIKSFFRRLVPLQEIDRAEDKIFKEDKNYKDAMFYSILGFKQSRLGYHTKSFSYFMKALDSAYNIKFDFTKISTYAYIGYLCAKAGFETKAKEIFQETFKMISSYSHTDSPSQKILQSILLSNSIDNYLKSILYAYLAKMEAEAGFLEDAIIACSKINYTKIPVSEKIQAAKSAIVRERFKEAKDHIHEITNQFHLDLMH